ncbi:hypothetical protein ACFYUV_33855 [Nonomuraea sp. NPDC003560]|uniref:hypothetical protein n=1 Tax=Nonomuraea sp. NPDC003560 TaxID=3364341 RepID=UPI00369A8046
MGTGSLRGRHSPKVGSAGARIRAAAGVFGSALYAVGWLLISFVTRTALGLLLVVAASPALVCHALPHTEGVVGL